MSTSLDAALGWLADAPIFIDRDQVFRLHDAVLQPDSAAGATTLTLDKESVRKLGGNVQAKGEVSPGHVVGLFKSLFNFKAELAGEVKGQLEKSTGESYSVILNPIQTPQRQLVQLALHYVANYGDRLFVVDDPARPEWRDAKSIQLPPRAVAFIDLSPETLILPTAAEFAEGKVNLIFKAFQGKDGGGQPGYVSGGNPDQRRNYWKWFRENVTAHQAMHAVEAAAEHAGRIRWIDFRVFFGNAGDTFHLHVSPAGEFDTGIFAYNLIARGFEHGVRLVGTLKSEPDMNVLAIYEK